MVPRHLDMALLVLLASQVCAGCNKDDDKNTHIGSLGPITGDGDSDEPADTSTSTGEAVTTDTTDATAATADVTATAAEPSEAPFEPICAFYGVKRAACFGEDHETSEDAELACREVIYQATLADGSVCHDAYADLYLCKTAGACEDLDRPSCLVEADTVAMACPHRSLF